MIEPRFCGGIGWDPHGTWQDPWRCPSVMTEHNQGAANRDGIAHMCAASYDHEGDHCCIMGHRWPQSEPRPRWRNRLRARLGNGGGRA